MISLKQTIEEISGFRFMLEELEILSPVGRRCLSESPFLTDSGEIENALSEVNALKERLLSAKFKEPLTVAEVKLMLLRDIKGTLARLSAKVQLTDIELFEVKSLALLAVQCRDIARQLALSFLSIPDVEAVVGLLDPEGKRIPHFYIYDAYSPTLASLRAQIRHMAEKGYPEDEIESIRIQSVRLEDDIRASLTAKLQEHATNLSIALNRMGHWDLLLAKAKLAIKMNLCKPDIVKDETRFEALFHPEVSSYLEAKRKHFQPVDITLPQSPTVVTGANMAGKSVLLKSIALAQTLAQYGFFVPAKSAKIVPVEKIAVISGDGEDESRGLSSYASEMLKLNNIILDAQQGVPMLVLIDELARTTNPIEGQAIVCGMLEFLIQESVRAVITTHYGIDMPVRKLRVKGFREDKCATGKISVEHINDYIDYSLEETTARDVPHEAIRIAEIVGVDDEFLLYIKRHLKNNI
ncbi:MAG: DNA mismatch repair protein MutS [Porphyromonas sp.]|nr:DNA mismatch repair protein MutS [Porphyromonas sp.]